jgi:hypothetical protein
VWTNNISSANWNVAGVFVFEDSAFWFAFAVFSIQIDSNWYQTNCQNGQVYLNASFF